VQDVTISKDKLLHTLEENRTKHRKVFEAAMEGYKEQVRKELETRLHAMDRGRIPDLVIHLTAPEDHTREYTAIIEEIKWHEGTTLDLDDVTFRQFVLDQWSWKRRWLTHSSNYAAATVNEYYSPEVSPGDDDDVVAGSRFGDPR
jgi:predicted nucleotide-binding protein (sugar kinase/HSP70/actin superfamily)